jgi:hypothetical protein
MSRRTRRNEPDTAALRILATNHGVDPRSIQREMREAGSVRGMAGIRARAAVREWRDALSVREP